jgi:hypothetical protein
MPLEFAPLACGAPASLVAGEISNQENPENKT